MSTEENKAVVRRFVEEVQGQQRLDLANEVMDPKGINHAELPPDFPSGLNFVEGFQTFYRMLLGAFPDLLPEIHDMLAEGDKVVTYKTFRGTHQGEFMGTPATGKHVEIDVIDIMRVANGKIVEHWAVIDMMRVMRQIGAVPTPGEG